MATANVGKKAFTTRRLGAVFFSGLGAGVGFVDSILVVRNSNKCNKK